MQELVFEVWAVAGETHAEVYSTLTVTLALTLTPTLTLALTLTLTFTLTLTRTYSVWCAAHCTCPPGWAVSSMRRRCMTGRSASSSPSSRLGLG